jgi:hypothetical protein
MANTTKYSVILLLPLCKALMFIGSFRVCGTVGPWFLHGMCGTVGPWFLQGMCGIVVPEGTNDQ